MFSTAHASGELSTELEPPASAKFGIRSVGLSQAPFTGAWCLPSLSPLVPHRVHEGASLADSSLAKFSLCAHRCGVPLVEDRFLGLQVTATQQWRAYLNAQGDLDNPLPMSLSIDGHPGYVHVELTSQSEIPLFRLKGMVEKLNALHDGLGWWAWFLIEDASSNYPMYSFGYQRHAALFAGWFEADTDQEAVEYIRECHGFEGTLEQMREELSTIWPSDFAAAAGGHGWMYRVREGANQQHPKRMSLAQVKAIAINCADPEIQQVLFAGLALEEANNRKILGNWDQYHGAVPECDDLEGCETLGSTCFVCWDAPSICFEVVEHAERFLMEAESRESFRIWRMSTDDPRALRNGVRALKAFMDLHARLGKFMSFFKEESE